MWLVCFIRVQPFATLWTVARQSPLSMGFPRQEYCSGLPYIDIWSNANYPPHLINYH